MRFSEFLLMEQREYLADKVGDILTSIHEILSNEKLSVKQTLRYSEQVVNQIRRVLHSSWPRTEHKFLKVLQKCAVAIMKAIEEKGDLLETLESVEKEIEDLSINLGEPINKLGSLKAEKPEEVEPEKPKQMQQQAASPSMMPPTSPMV